MFSLAANPVGYVGPDAIFTCLPPPRSQSACEWVTGGLPRIR